MHKKILNTYSLKFNPFAPNLPTESLYLSPAVKNFIWRIEQLTREGGYGLVTGGVGSQKSSTLRLLAYKFAEIPDVKVGVNGRINP